MENKETHMFGIIKKALLTGVGLAVMTEEKVEQLARDIAEKCKLSEKEGRDLTDDLLAKSEQARKDLEARIEKLVAEGLCKLDVPSRADVAKLADRIAALEAALKEHRQQHTDSAAADD